MAVKIHHGPPGSYKTSGAILDDFVPAVFAGRLIVTNVRGLNDEERIRSVLAREFPKKTIPKSFELHFVDTDTLEGLFAIQTFWQWVDCGAFLIIDEAQAFWPAEMKPTDWRAFDFPPAFDRSGKIEPFENSRLHGRPFDYADAWTRHRHFNWDIVLTTPDIKLFHTKIRSVSECAYRHKNQAVIGLKGRYLEGFHLASNSGNSSDVISILQRRIPSWVFELYQSTSTGVVSDSRAGRPFWKEPKVMFLGLFFCLLVAHLISRGNPLSAVDSYKKEHVVSPSSSLVPSTYNSSVPLPSSAAFDPFGLSVDKQIWLVGCQTVRTGGVFTKTYLFELASPDELSGTTISSVVFLRLGYKVEELAPALVSISKGSQKYFARYRGVKDDNQQVPSL